MKNISLFADAVRLMQITLPLRSPKYGFSAAGNLMRRKQIRV